MMSVMTSCSVSWVTIGEEKEYPKAVPAPLVDDFKISDDIFSFEFALDYVIYDMPCPLSEFLDNGWTAFFYDGTVVDLNTILPYGNYEWIGLKNGKCYIHVELINTSAKELAYKDCIVMGFSAFQADLRGMDMILPKNLLIHSNLKKEDIAALYGESDEPDEDDESDYDDLLYNDKNISHMEGDDVTIYQGGYYFYVTSEGLVNHIYIGATVAVKEVYSE